MIKLSGKSNVKRHRDKDADARERVWEINDGCEGESGGANLRPFLEGRKVEQIW